MISYATLGELVELYQTDYLGELNQSDTYLAELDELNTQVSWTDTHLEELNELVRSSELVRPLEKIPSVNSISDEPSQSLQGSKSYPWPRPIRIAKENMLDEWACFGLHLDRNVDPNIFMVYNFGQEVNKIFLGVISTKQSKESPKTSQNRVEDQM